MGGERSCRRSHPWVCPGGTALLDTGQDCGPPFPGVGLSLPLTLAASTSRLDLPLGMGVPTFGLGNRIHRPRLVAEKPACRPLVQHLSLSYRGQSQDTLSYELLGGRESTDDFGISGNQCMTQSCCFPRVCWQRLDFLLPGRAFSTFGPGKTEAQTDSGFAPGTLPFR